MNYIEEYYTNYDEDGRLLSNHGQVEYRTTMKYIHEVAENIGAKKISDRYAEASGMLRRYVYCPNSMKRSIM